MRLLAENVKLSAAVMRFYTTHLLGLVVVAAFVFGLTRHPEALRAALVPLAAGVFVVLPVLGTLELFTPRSATRPEVNWRGVVAASVVAIVGVVLSIVAIALLAEI